jgi:hypothetical protein
MSELLLGGRHRRLAFVIFNQASDGLRFDFRQPTATASVSQFRPRHPVLFSSRGHDALAPPFGFWFPLKPLGVTAKALAEAIEDRNHAATLVKRSY